MGGLLNLKKGVATIDDLKDVSPSLIAGDLNTLAGAVASATFVIGAETTSRTIGIQLVNAAGVDLAIRSAVFAYLSDNVNGDTIIASAPSGGVVGGTDGITIPLVTGKAFQLVSEVDGDIDVVITESGAATFYLVLVMPNGKLVVSAAITFAA